MAHVYPNIGARGDWKLSLPFVTAKDVVHTCIAIRYLTELLREGVDPYAKYYSDHDIPRNQYEDDLANNGAIVTLVSELEVRIDVPTSYILSYPDENIVPYSHVVLSISLGAIPDELNLTFLKQQIVLAANEVAGLNAEVKEHVIPTTGLITRARHEVMEQLRQAKITNRVTDRVRVKQLQDQLAQERAIRATLEQVVINAGLVI